MRSLRRRPAPVRMFNTGHPDDDARLEVLAEDDGLQHPHSWSHFLWFETQEAAHEATQRLEPAYAAKMVENPIGPGWIVQGLREGVLLTPEAVSEARGDLTGLAQILGGRYDGWQAWV